MNSCSESGRLTKDVQLQEFNTSKGSIPYADFTLAVTRNFKNKQTGDYDADFINFIATGHSAKYLADYCHKGDYLEVHGRLQTKKKGNNFYWGIRTRQLTNVSRLLHSQHKNTNSNNSYGSADLNKNNGNVDNSVQPKEDPFAKAAKNGSKKMDISNDDLPF